MNFAKCRPYIFYYRHHNTKNIRSKKIPNLFFDVVATELRRAQNFMKKIVVIAAIAIGGCYWKLMKSLVHYENYLISFYILNSSVETHKGIVSLGIELRARLLNLLGTAGNLQVLCFWKDIELPIWMHLTNKCHCHPIIHRTPILSGQNSYFNEADRSELRRIHYLVITKIAF